ncbi:MAG: DUF2059 domain-containing protein [Candidatus Zixiibacteriota bacterium]
MKETSILFLVLAVGVVLLLAQTIFTEDTNPRYEHIRQLQKSSGARGSADAVVPQTLAQIRKSITGVPDEYWDQIYKSFSVDTLFERMIPIYAKYLTDEDVQALVVFYSSPAGQRYSKALPAITKDAVQVGNEWGQEIVAAAMAKLRERGYVK